MEEIGRLTEELLRGRLHRQPGAASDAVLAAKRLLLHVCPEVGAWLLRQVLEDVAAGVFSDRDLAAIAAECVEATLKAKRGLIREGKLGAYKAAILHRWRAERGAIRRQV